MSEIPRNQGHLSRDLERARGLAQLLDSAIRIPVIGVRIGMDALLGLVPGGGDAVGALLGAYPIVLAVRHRLPHAVVVRLLGNIAVDAIFGSVPIIGDLFDIGFKSNLRNQRLIERYAAEPTRTTRSSQGIIWIAVGGIALIVAALLALTIWLVSQGLSRITT
ncbi:MAG TPA: DUF4112 domain-containing protein [Gemmatimonadaceae bacterium]|jgi:hypothetical protein|nr:DUF4112 domain-containing protein [Gemmatimonadaceae bacterium]